MGKEVRVGFEDLLVQAKITNKLLAAQLRSQLKQQDLVALLVGTGASIREIAEIANTTPATVNTTIARFRKQRGDPGGKRKREKDEP